MKRLTFHQLFTSPRVLSFGLVALCLSGLCTSCLDDESLSLSDTPMNNFKSCWRTLDEHYCYFGYKNIDWDDVYRRYEPYFRDSISNDIDLFQGLYRMLGELHDGHVNLYSSFNVARNWSWMEDYPKNFDAGLLERYYLGTRYWMAGGMSYGMLSDTIGYIYYPSFAATVTDSNLDHVLALLSHAKGLIFDVRDNGGGNLTNVTTIASHFCVSKATFGYLQHKNGPAHDNFSDFVPLVVKPAKKHIHWDASVQPVVILTNRACFSATNSFVMAMKHLDGATSVDSTGNVHHLMIKTMGDRTGGGGGLPFESTLPNGWIVRFSTSPMFTADKEHIENGFAPDFHVEMDSLHAFQDHKDDIIEAARDIINKNTSMKYKSKKDQND